MEVSCSPFFSIIVPVYNVESYIDTCIKSLLEQTFDNYEIIIVDDGSTDKSLERCTKYVSEKCMLINKKNGGVSSARNVGIKNAKGKYIVFVDADDYCDKDYLETFFEIITKTNSDLVLTSYYVNEKPNENSISDDSFHAISKEDVIIKCLEKKIPIFNTSLWNKVFLKEIVMKTNLFNTDLSLGEDMVFLMEYISKCDNIVYSMVPKYHYIVRTGSAAMTVNEKNLSVIRAHNMIKKYVKNDEIKKYIDRRLEDSLVVLLRIAVKNNCKNRKLIKTVQCEINNIENEKHVEMNKIGFFMLTHSYATYRCYCRLKKVLKNIYNIFT